MQPLPNQNSCKGYNIMNFFSVNLGSIHIYKQYYS